MDGHHRTTRPRLTAALAAGALLALAACTGAPAPEEFVTRLADDRTSEDEIAPRLLPDGTEPGSVRLLVDHDGVRFYAASSAGEDGEAVCLVLVVPTDDDDDEDDDSGGSACRRVADLDDDGVHLDLMLTEPGVRVEAVLVPDGTTPVTDLPAVTPNLFATVSWQA